MRKDGNVRDDGGVTGYTVDDRIPIVKDAFERVNEDQSQQIKAQAGISREMTYWDAPSTNKAEGIALDWQFR